MDTPRAYLCPAAGVAGGGDVAQLDLEHFCSQSARPSRRVIAAGIGRHHNLRPGSAFLDRAYAGFDMSGLVMGRNDKSQHF